MFDRDDDDEVQDLPGGDGAGEIRSTEDVDGKSLDERSECSAIGHSSISDSHSRRAQPRPGRNPPEHSRFKPGHSGNPKGRPKGRKNAKTVYLEAMNKKIHGKTDRGRPFSRTALELSFEQLSRAGAQGNLKAIDMMLKHGWDLGLFADETPSSHLGHVDDGLAPDADALKRILQRIARMRPPKKED